MSCGTRGGPLSIFFFPKENDKKDVKTSYFHRLGKSDIRALSFLCDCRWRSMPIGVAHTWHFTCTGRLCREIFRALLYNIRCTLTFPLWNKGHRSRDQSSENKFTELLFAAIHSKYSFVKNQLKMEHVNDFGFCL